MSRKKRNRAQAGTDSKVPGRDADLPSPSPAKRQRTPASRAAPRAAPRADPRAPALVDPYADILPPERSAFTAQHVASVGRSIPPRVRLGGDFHRAIQRLRDGSDESVSTRFNLKVQVGSGRESISETVPVAGTFSVFQHTTTELVQGNLVTAAHSAYKARDDRLSVLPRHLSRQRATLESRAIKQLADSGRGYDAAAKWTRLDEAPLVNRDQEISKQAPLGGIALASHLEDITAKRAVGLEHVGSAIRASLLSVKWRQLSGESAAGRNFRARLLASFPQLGNKDLPAGGLPEGGISALRQHWQEEIPTFSKEVQLAKIQIAHDNASEAARLRFSKKLKALETTRVSRGEWWRENERSLLSALSEAGSGSPGTRAQGAEALQDIRRDYVARKLGRHGIKND